MIQDQRLTDVTQYLDRREDFKESQKFEKIWTGRTLKREYSLPVPVTSWDSDTKAFEKQI